MSKDNKQFYIRSSKHTLAFSNSNKKSLVSDFIDEYRRVAKIYLDYLWQPRTYQIKGKSYLFNINKKRYSLPRLLSTVSINKELDIKTFLSAMAMKCCITQVLSLARGTLKKHFKRQYVANKCRARNKSVPRKLRKRLRSVPSRPDVSCLNPEINTACFNYRENTGVFDAWIQLQSFTNTRNLRVNLPIKFHRQSNKWNKQGKLLNSILLCKDHVELRWQVPLPKKKTRGKILGADQGARTILTLSDGQTTPLKDIHGHTLDSILRKLVRKRKGSRAFSRTTGHRKNFINWSVKQLNLDQVKIIKLESLKHYRYKKNSGRYLSHWTNTLITSALGKRCEQEKVSLVYDGSTYYSQRCSQCGLVLKSNRTGKRYTCKNCDLRIDSDLNSALNHQQELIPIPRDLRMRGLNCRGFYWRPTGFYDLEGEELTVPLAKNELRNIFLYSG